VVTSEMLLRELDITKTRDFLWKTINEQRNLTTQLVLKEEVLTSYVGLLAYFSMVRKDYTILIEKMKNLESEMIWELLSKTESNVLKFQGANNENYTSAMLGNALRKSSNGVKTSFLTKSSDVVRPIREVLFSIIAKPNSDILHSSRVTPKG
jgi:hypothetical protein